MLFGYYFKRVIKFVIALGCVVKLGKAMFQLFVDEMSFLANFSCFQPHNIRMLYLFVRDRNFSDHGRRRFMVSKSLLNKSTPNL